MVALFNHKLFLIVNINSLSHTTLTSCSTSYTTRGGRGLGIRGFGIIFLFMIAEVFLHKIRSRKNLIVRGLIEKLVRIEKYVNIVLFELFRKIRLLVFCFDQLRAGLRKQGCKYSSECLCTKSGCFWSTLGRNCACVSSERAIAR